MEVKLIDENLESHPYHIRPEDINTDRHFLGAFGQCEIEIVAKYIVRLCLKLGGWKSFTKEDIDKFWQENGGKDERIFNNKDRFPFYWIDERHIVKRSDGKYCVTDFFINRCFQSSPKKIA